MGYNKRALEGMELMDGWSWRRRSDFFCSYVALLLLRAEAWDMYYYPWVNVANLPTGAPFSNGPNRVNTSRKPRITNDTTESNI